MIILHVGRGVPRTVCSCINKNAHIAYRGIYLALRHLKNPGFGTNRPRAPGVDRGFLRRGIVSMK